MLSWAGGTKFSVCRLELTDGRRQIAGSLSTELTGIYKRLRKGDVLEITRAVVFSHKLDTTNAGQQHAKKGPGPPEVVKRFP